MKGVSEVIAIILILMITIALAATAYMFFSTTVSDVTSSAGSTVSSTTTSMLTSFTIESISQNHVYVRNTGQNALTGLGVYVDDIGVNASVPESILPGNVGTINLTYVLFEGDTIKVTSTNGVSASKPAPLEWYGAVGYWKLDENGGQYAFDSSSNANTGNLTNNPAWTSGKFGSGLQFDGAGAYVNVENASSLNPTSITITAWVYPILFRREAIICKGDISAQNGVSYAIYLWGDSATPWLEFRIWGNTANQGVVLGPNLLFNNWNFIVATYDGSTMKITSYKPNGVIQNATSAYVGGIPMTNSSVRFGRTTYGPIDYFNGTIDDVTIWNRSLTETEILKIYNKAIY